ncbi:hypothetical protein DES49_0565 [Halospina denitrificans]|uniref:Type II secretory pathway component PulF n=1 Tax=Halospina denitrificans TaxID=332522 RepID=A0A4V3ER26_9GAMM|nr:hypothetical protein [Halospina denitrificans]TDT44458.1 hypothetical protein DES49_0565 [Halospina denitrificans]
MVWERFHHICRRSLAPLRPGESLAGRIRAVEADPDTAFYGARLKPGTLPRRILDRIAADPNQDRACRLLEFYASLNLDRETTHALKLKRVAIYLAWVSVLFLVIYGIYQVLVMQGFIPLPETFQIQIPSPVALFRQYVWPFAITVVVLLGLALVMGHALRRLVDWSSSHGRIGLTRFLAFPGARAAYADLETAVLFPLGPDVVEGTSKIASHLWKLEEEGNEIRDEVAALVRCRHRTLIERCEKQMCVVYTFCILLIVLTIALFVAGGYVPATMLP